MLRIATFNMENLFSRPTAMNFPDDAEGRQALEDFGELNAIVAKPQYTQADKDRLADLSVTYGFHKLNQTSDLLRLNKIRGRLYSTAEGANRPTVVADGRDDWVGWFYLLRDDIDWRATENTARVLDVVKADVVVCVEVEDRTTLQRFNDQVLGARFGAADAYPHNILVDGNDERGIDVGLLSKFPIRDVRTHYDTPDPNVPGHRLFSRDCPEFEIELPGGQVLIVLGNHFKSKRSGDNQTSKRKRKAQATEAKNLYLAARQRSPLVVVAGDLNDSPDSDPLSPLLTLPTDVKLRDVMESPKYTDPLPGTFGTAKTAANKFDYILLPPDLFSKIKAVEVERRGVYHPNTWTPFPEVRSEVEQASDHGTLWVDIDV